MGFFFSRYFALYTSINSEPLDRRNRPFYVHTGNRENASIEFLFFDKAIDESFRRKKITSNTAITWTL